MCWTSLHHISPPLLECLLSWLLRFPLSRLSYSSLIFLPSLLHWLSFLHLPLNAGAPQTVYTHSQVIIFGDPPLTTTSTPATPTSPSPAKASLLSSRPAILTTQNSGLLWDGPQRFIHMCRLETELFTLLHKPAPHPACPSSGAGATIQRHRQTTGNLEVNLNTVFPLIGL